MKKRWIIGAAVLGAVVAIAAVNTMKFHGLTGAEQEMIDHLDAGLDGRDVEISERYDHHEGFFGEGDSLYKIQVLGDKRPDIDAWDALPMNSEVERFYLTDNDTVDAQAKELTDIKQGRWKLIGENHIDGWEEWYYGNVVLIVYDEEENAFYYFRDDT